MIILYLIAGWSFVIASDFLFDKFVKKQKVFKSDYIKAFVFPLIIAYAILQLVPYTAVSLFKFLYRKMV